MVRGVDLERLCDVAADVDDLRPALGREEALDHLDARGLPFRHDDVSKQDVDLRFSDEDTVKLEERAGFEDGEGLSFWHCLGEKGLELLDALGLVIKYDDGGHA